MAETQANAPDDVTIHSAVDLCAYYQIKLKEGRELLQPGLTPQQYYAELRSRDFLADARRVLTHVLPKRRALWWACLCATDAQRVKPAPLGDAVIAAVTRFVVEPTEEHRRATSPLGQSAGYNTLPGNLAMAAFFSGGSVLAAGLPFLAPRPQVTGRLTSVTIYLASVRRNPRRYKDTLRQYLDLGAAIARGERLWTAHDHSSTSSMLVPELASTQAFA